jgi:hypothetical protein
MHASLRGRFARLVVSAVIIIAVAGVLQGGATPHVTAEASPASLPGRLLPQGLTGVTPSRVLDTRTGVGAPAAPVGPGSSIDVQITGLAGVPVTGVDSVVMNLTVTGPTAPSYITAWPTGAARPTTANLNFTPGQTVPNLVVIKVGAGGKVSLFNNAGSAHLIADVTGWYSTGSQFISIVPQRLLDTRSGQGGVIGPTSGEVDVSVLGVAGVPTSGVTAVVVNVVAVEPTSDTFLTVWPNGFSRPDTANLNVRRFEIRPNLVVVKVGTEGKISYFNGSGRTHVVLDVFGYITGGTRLTEVLDSVDANVNSWSESTRQVQGTARFNSLTYAGNLFSSTTPSWTEYNLGRSWKTLATTLSFDDINSTASSRVRFRILGDGVELLNRTLTFGQTVDVSVNVTNVLRLRFEVFNANTNGNPNSFYPVFATPLLTTSASPPPLVDEYRALVPSRILDTRTGVGAGQGRVGAEGVVELQVLGRGGVPLSGVGAVVLNLAVTDPSTSGYITAWPTGIARPLAASANFVGGETVSNTIAVPVGANGRISFFNSAGFTHVIADVQGWSVGSVSAAPTSGTLTEVLDSVDANVNSWSESTRQVQGTARFNSLTYAGNLFSSTTPSWTEYNLGRSWKTLATTLSFDDINSTASSRVRFRILGDGVELLNRTLTFGQTVDVSVNVTNVLRLRFEVFNANTNGNPNSFYPVFATPVLTR